MKVWCIDIENLNHELEFSIYKENNIEFVLSRNEKEIERHLSNYSDTIEVIVVQASTKITPEIMKSIPNLKGICTFSMGFNNIDLATANELGITVSNVPDYSTSEVADHTVTLMLNAIRDIKNFDIDVNNGIWEPIMKNPIRRINQLTIGLLGFGKISREVSKRLVPFGVKIISYDQYVDLEEFEKHNVKQVTFEEFLFESDVISIHAPLTPETNNMIDSQAIDKMKNNVIIINTSRGAIINEVALADALLTGKVLRAAVDVIKDEPMSLNHPYKGKDNMIITPHVAYISIESEKELQTKTATNVLKILNGERPNYIVNDL